MYNIFKRPMFKRGGSTTGTGIMSHVEPRVKAANGFGQFGNQFAKPNFSLVGKPFTPSSTALTVIPEASMSTAATTGLTGLGTLATLTPNALMSFYLGYGAKPRQAEEILGMSGEAAGFDQLREAMSYLGAPGRQMVSEEKRLFEEMNKDETARRLAQLKQTQVQDERQKQLEREQEKKINESLKENTTYEASDIKSETVKEANMIREILKDEDFSRGELALIFAETLKEPGGLNAKLNKARELAKPIFRKRREEDKSITLTAYKLAKEKEKEEIKAGKLGETEKFVEKRVQLGLKNAAKTKSPTGETLYDGLTENQYREKVYSERLGEDKYSENLAKTRLANEGVRLGRAIEKINELQAKQKTGTLTKEEVTELATKTKFVRSLSNLPGFKTVFGPSLDDPAYIGGYASGGRVNFVEGGMTEVDSVNPIETSELATNNNETAIKPVQKLSFQELRSRLPKEITDDIVTLLANSEQALQDFAYLQTQQDVGNFNVKYGVNLVLPPQT